MFERPDIVKGPLYVITCIFNPVRFRSRWRLYQDFKTYCQNSGVELYTVEIAFGNRAFSVTSPDDPKNLQLRTVDELWIKENALNLIMKRLPADWQYVAWVDADVTFVRPDWADETMQQLQHYDVVQMWTEAYDTSPQYETQQSFKGFMWCYCNDIPYSYLENSEYNYPYSSPKGVYWHPGYAWAARRTAIDTLGGLLDWHILGGGDMYMANALIQKAPTINLSGVSQQWYTAWWNRAARLNKNVGYVDGTLIHYWHGPKVNRRYKERTKILIENEFNPAIDIYKDWQGLYQLEPNQWKMRDEIRTYFRERNEDAI